MPAAEFSNTRLFTCVGVTLNELAVHLVKLVVDEKVSIPAVCEYELLMKRRNSPSVLIVCFSPRP
jgi:hypothetical protein